MPKTAGPFVTTVTQKGQVTIPREIREAAGLQPRDRVEVLFEGGEVIVRRAHSIVDETYGSIPPRGIDLGDWRRIREYMREDLADRETGGR